MSDFITDILPRLLNPKENDPLIEIEADPPWNSWGSVYLFSIRDFPGHYKIGISNDVKVRLASIRSSMPFNTIELESYITLPCNYYKSLERYFHKKFQAKRVRNEWFLLDENDIEQIYEVFGILDEWRDIQHVNPPINPQFETRIARSMRHHLRAVQFKLLIEEMRIGLWNRDTETLRQQMELPEKVKLEFVQSRLAELYELLALELATVQIERLKSLEFEEVRQIVRRNAEYVRDHAIAVGRDLGIDIATDYPLLNERNS